MEKRCLNCGKIVIDKNNLGKRRKYCSYLCGKKISNKIQREKKENEKDNFQEQLKLNAQRRNNGN
jgi:hypothetical protein